MGCDKKNDEVQTSTPAANASRPDASASPTTQPDNSAINTRDRAADAVTSGTQGQSKSDVDLTADIRRRVMDTKMSVNAHNVKIICSNGKVMLRGPVNAQEEKEAIANLAGDVAGATNVDNKLEIKPNG